jgi:hypothetical protein
MAQEMCRHQGCTCAATRDGYCSTYCKSETGSAEHGACACAHDECRAPSKFESKAAFADLAPGGRFVENPTPRDW